MDNINYARLSNENFSLTSMDEFLRYQKITQAYKKIGNAYELVDSDHIIDWDLEKRRSIAQIIIRTINDGGFAFGAFEGDKFVGYILASGKRFGSAEHYIKIALFHVSSTHRKMGIGRQLFRLACEEARNQNARKLYISAGNAKETQDAYRKLGCVPAAEIDPESVERATEDIQLEYLL